jgi:predicted RNA polymerase sigma factor
MLLTEARRPARTRADGALVPLAEQDRTRWDLGLIAEGNALITEAKATTPIGPYQVQAAIAALHDEAGRAEDTDWPQILGLYDLLNHLAPGPIVTLSRAVAVAMVHGPQSGLDVLAAEPTLAEQYRFFAVRGHLLELAGDPEAARTDYLTAAARTQNLPERHHLESRAANLSWPEAVDRGRSYPSRAVLPGHATALCGQTISTFGEGRTEHANLSSQVRGLPT